MAHTYKRTQSHLAITIALVLALSLSPIPVPLWGGTSIKVAHAMPAKSSPINSKSVDNEIFKTQPKQDESSLNRLVELSGMNALSMADRPEGMLVDSGAAQNATALARHQASTIANPLSVSRVQSAYRSADAISDTLVITFTVTNNRPPSIIPPQLPVSATITDTIAAMPMVDYSSDPNAIHNVLIADSLTSYAMFIDSAPMPDRAALQYAWNLGDIPPLSSVTATLTVRVPATVADLIELDTGAIAWGTLQGRMVKTQARPANLAPNTINGEPIGDWLKWTVDADKYDEYMLAKAAELGQDPIRMFEYVRSLRYESYEGSLRGTRGTLWSEAGNSLDQASLLIAMLRASGIPSRYRHGTLDETPAQELICSMFPEPTNLVGHIKWTHETSGG